MPAAMLRTLGREQFEQEAWLAVCKAAHDFDPVKYLGVPFGAFARLGVRKHLTGTVCRTATKYGVWRTMPELDGDTGEQLEAADYRRESADPALAAWCSADYARQRRCLDWRSRIVLYLRAVEGWTLEEAGEALAVTRERIRQVEEKAVRKLARFRLRRQMRRQLEGRPG